MAVEYEKDLHRNISRIWEELRKLGTSRVGPTSVGPGEGWHRYFDDGGDTFYVDSAGPQVKFRGGLTGLTSHLEANATKQEQQDSTLGSLDTRIATERSERLAVQAQVQGQIATERETRMAIDAQLTGQISTERTDRIAVDQSLSGRITDERADRIAVDNSLSGRITTAQSTANGAVSDASAAQSRADSAYSRAGTAQDRADSAYSRAGTAQNRADDAYSLASGAAGSREVAELRSEIDNLKVRIARLENAGPG